MLRLIIAAAFLAAGIWSPAYAGAAEATYGNSILLGAGLAKDKLFQPVIADLTSELLEMTGLPFTVSDLIGDQPAIFLTLSPTASPAAAAKLAGKGLEAFSVLATPDRIEIAANDVQGLSHGVYYVLEQLGVRWLLPGPKWTVVPKRKDIRLTIDRLIEPDFKVRGYAGTGGFYSAWWGRHYAQSPLTEAANTSWMRQLRYGGEYRLASHTGQAFLADKAYTPILEQHSEYLAKIGGSWSPLRVKDRRGNTIFNFTAKINAGNPDAVALYCEWTLGRLRLAQKNPMKRNHMVVSVEPSDGNDYADNVSELPGNGSPSDQTFFIANACARTVRAAIPGASVVLLAYYAHADPPSFALESNVIVELAPYAFQGRDPDALIKAWHAKGVRLALYDYWSIPDWVYEQPVFKYADLPGKLRAWRAEGIEGIQAESTYGAGAMGPSHYIAAHMMWSLDQDSDALIEDWFKTAFGAAKAPMQRMMGRWSASFRLTATELTASYADLTEALRLAKGDAAALARVTDFGRYLHYLRLRYELELEILPAGQSQRALALVEYLLDINDTFMVHGTRVIDLYNRKFGLSEHEFDLKDPAHPGPGWSRVHFLTDDEVRALIATDRARFADAAPQAGTHG